MLAIVLLAVFLVAVAGDSLAGGKGKCWCRPWVKIEITPPEEEVFSQGEETSFGIELVTRLPEHALRNMELTATFPDAQTPVELTKLDIKHYLFYTSELTKVGENVLTAQLWKTNPALARALECVKEKLERRVEYLEDLLDRVTNPRLRRCIQRLIEIYSHVIARIDRRIADSSILIATASAAITVEADTTPPTIYDVYPKCGESATPYTDIEVVFSEPINPDTVTADTFRVCVMEIAPPVVESRVEAAKNYVRQNGFTPWCYPVEGTYSFDYDDTVVKFTPSTPFPMGCVVWRYVGPSETGTIEDRFGNGLEESLDCWIYMNLTCQVKILDMYAKKDKEKNEPKEKKKRSLLNRINKDKKYDVKTVEDCIIEYQLICAKEEEDGEEPQVEFQIYVKYTDTKGARHWFYHKVLKKEPKAEDETDQQLVPAILLGPENKAPDDYTGEKGIKWTGRDGFEWKKDKFKCDCNRILLPGKYELKIRGKHPTLECKPKTYHFTVAKPYAHCYGPFFPESPTYREGELRLYYVGAKYDGREGAKEANKTFKELKYNVLSEKEKVYARTKAAKALEELKAKDAILSFTGHGWTGRIWFYDNVTDAQTGKWNWTSVSQIAASEATRDYKLPPGGTGRTVKSNSKLLSALGSGTTFKDGDLKDVLLVVTLSCMGGDSGTPPKNENNLAKVLFEKGVDFVVALTTKGPTEDAVDRFYTKFLSEAKKTDTNGKYATVQKAADEAIKHVAAAGGKNTGITGGVFMAPGFIGGNEPKTVYPTRYGCTKKDPH